MKDMGILDSRRDGQMIYYTIVGSELADHCQLILAARQDSPPVEEPEAAD
jgi:hypothetical protein